MDGKVSEMEAVQKKNKYEIDMCNGTIMDKLVSFSLPLMLSGILCPAADGVEYFTAAV